MAPDDDEVTYGLVMPFVVCASNGGPYDDEAYVCGWEAAAVDGRLKAGQPDEWTTTVHTPNIPQLDLVAMNHGYELVRPAELPDEWTEVTFIKGGRYDEDVIRRV